jgi:hypothetical protein
MLINEKASPVLERLIVGVARFELTISWSQTKRDTGLRYTPKIWSRKTILKGLCNNYVWRLFSFFFPRYVDFRAQGFAYPT